jgi:ATPase subunit of ABC transporter with duplicated ATPase domains
MGHVEVAHVSLFLPDGRCLLYDVGFRVGEGDAVALLGANGAGKTTLLRIVAGELEPTEGTVVRSGTIGFMPQFVGALRDATEVRDLLARLAPGAIGAAARRLYAAERALDRAGDGDADAQMAYAEAVSGWDDVRGWEAEVLWETCCREAIGAPLDALARRPVSSLSGGEQKRLALEALLRGPADVLCLDEPDNYLDVPAKRWLERALASTPKAVLYVSHDREVIAATARRIVTVEARTAWTHGGGFAGYAEARRDRHARLAELRRRWDEEHERLRRLVARLRQQASISDALASRYQAAQTRLRKFEEAGPPPLPPREQRIAMRLRGGRTGVRAVTCRALAITGLVEPFDLEVLYGERVCVLGRNGSGKSHFLRLLAGEPVAHTGDWKLGARVVPGHFAQTHARPDLAGRPPLDALRRAGLDRSGAMASLSRYGLAAQAEQRFETLSGGQQARLQILLLETAGATLLLLDEPTDNLDLESAEALEDALDAFEGTVLAVTHDRWFARRFDRYAVFRADGRVAETAEPVWDDGAGDASRRRPARTA